MEQQIGMLLMVCLLFTLTALNVIAVMLMVRRNRRFVETIRGMRGTGEYRV